MPCTFSNTLSMSDACACGCKKSTLTHTHTWKAIKLPALPLPAFEKPNANDISEHRVLDIDRCLQTWKLAYAVRCFL